MKSRHCRIDKNVPEFRGASLFEYFSVECEKFKGFTSDEFSLLQ